MLQGGENTARTGEHCEDGRALQEKLIQIFSIKHENNDAIEI